MPETWRVTGLTRFLSALVLTADGAPASVVTVAVGLDLGVGDVHVGADRARSRC